MDNLIVMSQKEIKKYDIIKKLINKELDGTQASELLSLTVRQIRRLKNKVSDGGVKALVHGNRGKPGNRSIPKDEKEKIVSLIKNNYPDFGPTLAAEKLFERHNIKRNKETIRSIMISEDIWKPKQKKKKEHRQWRQRKACPGEMIQYDGSYERWFEDRGEKCCLLAGIDDADNKVWARFDEHEGVEPTFRYWRDYTERNGKPNSIYVDRFSTYSMNHKLAKENPDTLTQFQRAMAELGIEVILARSPQAKGRIEQLFGTLQDRLIKELRLNNISTIKEANEFLEKEFLPKFNAKFMVEPRSKTNLRKKLTKQEKGKLDSIFSRQYERVIKNDFTVSHKKKCYQLEDIQPVTICKQDKAIVEERADGTVRLRLRGKYLNYRLLPEKQKRINESKNNIQWAIPGSGKKYVPPADHPWRQMAKMEYLRKLTKVSK